MGDDFGLKYPLFCGGFEGVFARSEVTFATASSTKWWRISWLGILLRQNWKKPVPNMSDATAPPLTTGSGTFHWISACLRLKTCG
jgi:hypothetical protein